MPEQHENFNSVLSRILFKTIRAITLLTVLAYLIGFVYWQFVYAPLTLT